jgi:Na+/melibiose symporter-like transporter
MILLITSVLTSTFIGSVYQAIGRKKTFTVGAVLSLIDITLLMYMDENQQWLMYPTVVLMGMS